MTTTRDENLRRASNLLALSFASYREGALENAFDLFIEACEVQSNDDTSTLSREVSALIDEAMSEAQSVLDSPYDGRRMVVGGEPDDDGVLTASDLFDGSYGVDDEDRVPPAVVAANFAELDAA